LQAARHHDGNTYTVLYDRGSRACGRSGAPPQLQRWHEPSAPQTGVGRGAA